MTQTMQYTILHIEDDHVDAELLQRAISTYQGTLNIKIVNAWGGQQALDILYSANAQNHLSYYVIVLDLWLPGMNGFEFLKKLRSEAELKQTPVFVLSGLPLSDHKIVALRNQVVAYVHKAQFSKRTDQLISLLIRYLRRRIIRR